MTGLLEIHDVERSREQRRSRGNHMKLLKWRELCRENSVIEDCVSRIKLWVKNLVVIVNSRINGITKIY